VQTLTFNKGCAEMDVDQLLKRYGSGKRHFPWVNLSEGNLTGAQLRGIRLSRANLAKASLVGADLSQANLSKAILREANLRKANLAGSKLYKANLSKARLDGIDLTGADLRGVNLDGANLSGAIMPDGTPYEQWIVLQHSQPKVLMKETMADDQPLSTLEGVNEQSLVVAESPETQEPSEPRVSRVSSRIRLAAQELISRIPWQPLCLLWLGYFLFGILLAIHKAPFLAWILAWSGSLIWVVDASMTWYVPITGAIAVMGSVPRSIVSLVISAVITLGLIWIMIGLDFGTKKAFKDGLWVGMLASAAMLVLSWLLDGADKLLSRGVLTSNFPMAYALLVAIITAMFGTIAWMSMEYRGFTLKRSVPAFASITGLGLLCGWAVEHLF
jgi:hypothetical protein